MYMYFPILTLYLYLQGGCRQRLQDSVSSSDQGFESGDASSRWSDTDSSLSEEFFDTISISSRVSNTEKIRHQIQEIRTEITEMRDMIHDLSNWHHTDPEEIFTLTPNSLRSRNPSSGTYSQLSCGRVSLDDFIWDYQSDLATDRNQGFITCCPIRAEESLLSLIATHWTISGH